MVNSASISFALCPLLTDGAIEALLTAGSPEQQAQYIPKMIDGSWTGSMNLTEAGAGSDLSQVRTRAEPQPDGSYKLFGTKIFITYGEHDLADNIVHLVLARVAGAPEGVKGISLFICPKFLLPDGSLGAATTCTAPASSTSWASRPAPRRCCSSATRAAPWPRWWARRTAAWSTCSS
jgi:alkylation response protein AidB-like acyl-CoA dehydrogenase